MPFGLCIAPFVFTKLLKPVNFKLRSLGFESVNYLDDYFLLGRSEEECLRNVVETVKILVELGFIVNFSESNLLPRKQCIFLGFKWNSSDLTVRPTEDKIKKVQLSINRIVHKQSVKIREFARLIGFLNSMCFTFKYSRIYIKQMERDKYMILLINEGDYRGKLKISEKSYKDLHWWLRKLPHSNQYIGLVKYKLEIFSDASSTGWGIFCNN
nr:unnamed protein product [Callosobruchus chinensis]